jgi:hypothetical protein
VPEKQPLHERGSKHDGRNDGGKNGLFLANFEVFLGYMHTVRFVEEFDLLSSCARMNLMLT